MRVVAWPLTTPGMVSCLTVVKAASRQDNGTGLAWLTAAFIPGIGLLRPSARQRALSGDGSDIGFLWVDDDTSTSWSRPPRRHWKTLALEADRLNPVFEGVGSAPRPGNWRSSSTTWPDDPVEAGMQALRAAGFLKHPYGRPRLGRPEDLGQGSILPSRRPDFIGASIVLMPLLLISRR